MQIAKVLIYNRFDLDYENKQLSGMSAMVLNLFDRIEFQCGADEYIEIPKSIFAHKDWFEQLLKIINKH